MTRACLHMLWLTVAFVIASHHLGGPAQADFYAEGDVYPDPDLFNLTPFNPLNWDALDGIPVEDPLHGGVWVGKGYPGGLYIGFTDGGISGEPTTLISRFGVLGLHPIRFEPPTWPGGYGTVVVHGAWNMSGSLDVGLGGHRT